MAQKVNIILVDDIDGSDAEETVTFGLDGSNYSIDLNAENAQELRDALAPFIGHARREGSSRGRRARKSASGASASAADIRAWARENDYEVSERGRVPAEVRQAYDAAH